MKTKLLFAGLLALTLPAFGTVVYSNVDTDTGGTVFFSTGPYTEIGDQLTLGGTERAANTATAQFFNGGTDGNFDAILKFFALGGPVGSQIGGSFNASGNTLAGGNVLNVSWNLGGLVLPDQVIFTISLANVDSGVDLGLDLFEPPGVGSSSNQFYIINNDGTYATGSQGNSQDNLYFSLDASAVQAPEPGTMLLMLLGIPGLALLCSRTR